MIQITFNIKSVKREKVREELFKIIGIDDKGHTFPDGIVFNHERKVRAAWKLLCYCMKYGINPYKFQKILFAILRDPADGIIPELKKMDFTQVRELFSALIAKGITIGVVTNDTTVSAKTCLKCIGIENDVSFLRTKESNCRRKPNSEAIRQFSLTFGIPANEMAVVGDAPADMKFARNGKVAYKIALLTGNGDEKSLSSLADVVYPDITYLKNDKILFPEC